MKDQWAAWLKETDMKLHAVSLKDTLQQKKDQLEELQVSCARPAPVAGTCQYRPPSVPWTEIDSGMDTLAAYSF